MNGRKMELSDKEYVELAEKLEAEQILIEENEIICHQYEELLKKRIILINDIISDLKETDRFELEDIREIAMDLIYDESTKNLTIEKIRNSKKMELDIWS